MSTFLVEYHYVPDIEARREPVRVAHRAYLDEAYQNGAPRLRGRGPRPGRPRRAARSDADDPGAALAWASGIPVAKAGLLRELGVRELRVAYPPDSAEAS